MYIYGKGKINYGMGNFEGNQTLNLRWILNHWKEKLNLQRNIYEKEKIHYGMGKFRTTIEFAKKNLGMYMKREKLIMERGEREGRNFER